MTYLSTLLISLLITISLTPVLIKIAGKIKAFDVPDERKVHTEPIPRIGGIAMAAGVFVPMLLWNTSDIFLKAYAMGAAIIVLFGIADDLKGLGYKIKFLGQIVSALIIVLYGGLKINNFGILLPEGFAVPAWITIPFTVILIVGVTNAINLADGLDGLAGGICLLSFCCIGYLAFLGENILIALLSLSLVGAIFGFLRFNTYPASLFMGDTGSQFLGFSLVTTSLWLTQSKTALSPVLPLIIFGFPVLDTISVMLERIAHGKSPFSPDKNHFHHRLMKLGLFHTEAVFVIYIIQSILVLSAFLFRFYSDWALLAGYIVFAVLIISGFSVAERTGFVFKRSNMIDKAIKGHLKLLSGKWFSIHVFFRVVEHGIPLLLFATCFIPGHIPVFVSVFALCLSLSIVLVWYLKKTWLYRLITVAIYLIVPIVVYLSTENIGFLQNHPVWLDAYGMVYIFLVFAVIVTLKLTRRRRGFKATPMDFLIFFLALVAPYAAGTYIQHKEIASMAAKTIMFFFSYEVLIGELRGSVDKLTFSTACSLVVLAGRGFFSI